MKRAIRILYVINALEVGGTERQLTDLINGLDGDVIAPHLCCLREPIRKSAIQVSCPAITLGIEKLGSPSSLIALVRLIRYLNRERIDIVQTFFIEGTLFGVLAAKLAKSPSVIVASKRDLGFMITGRVLKRLQRAYRYVDRFLANSASVKKQLATGEGVELSRIDVIYNGIDVDAWHRKSQADSEGELGARENIEEGALIVGICANLNRHVKRVDLFLNAAAQVAEVRRDVHFLVIGDGELKESLMRLADRLGVGDKTRFVGSLSNPAPVIRSFTVGVISSDSEGFSNSIMEYMAGSVPVVATRVGGNQELVEDGVTGLLVPPGNAEEMAAAIRHLLDQPALRQAFGEAAQRIVNDKYSNEQMIRAHEKYYASIIKRSHDCSARPEL